MKRSLRFLFLILQILCYISVSAQNNTNNLVRIPYNNPELKSVDLGVGLWAWPFQVDNDNDGGLDLLVNCPDKPFNGLWLFENTTGGKNQVLKPPVRLAESQRNLQIFQWKGKYVATTPGVAYSGFLSSFHQNPDTLFKEDFYKSILKKPRLNLWRYVDFENDGDLDILIAIDDWADYGWANAFNEKGIWTNGPLHGTFYLAEQTKPGVCETPKQIIAGGKPIDKFSIPGSPFEDFYGDGYLDIILGEFLYRLTWFENTGKKDKNGPVFKTPVYLQQEPQYLKFGALVTPFSTDWDRDGLPDFPGNSINVNFLRNKGTQNGLTILEDLGPLSKTVLAGHSTLPTLFGWDKNEIPVLLIGAEDGHFYYLKNK